MPTLTITRGLPASGKTTYARAWVAEDPARRARVNRDDLRAQLHAGTWLGPDTERPIVAVQHAAIRALLDRGVDVICDDTNLPARTVRDLRRVAVLAGAEFAVVDLTDVPLETCLERNAGRIAGGGLVPQEAIIDMNRRYIAGQRFPLPIPVDEADGDAVSTRPYVPFDLHPRAVMVDVDGTVALMVGRSPYDETRVHEDRPNSPVIAVVRAMVAAGYRIVFCSGRTEACRRETEKWLAEHVAVTYDGLFMRAVGDMRKDSAVKAELFDRHIRDAYWVVAVLDDRDQVVRMWRGLGLTVLQVAEGAF